MGISGLLPLLEKGKVSRPANIKDFANCTVAVDAYCWLHKGAFSCADKLARGEETDMFVQYCMKFVNLLLSHNIKPILVFDGRHLPAKAATEKKRREKREENRKQAASLLRQGHSTEALSFLRRCVDVTHKMALKVMQQCRKRNVDCIVAPYEADAQLAFFSLEHIADLIVTEDSDLLLFGCEKVMFKLDLTGNGVLVEQCRLHQAMGIRSEMYSFDKFRYMCILSGCDYLDSLPGIGLGKACKFISRTQDPDIHKALARLPSQLNIRGLSVPLEYRDEFLRADAMFRHQLVFDPISRTTRPLTPFQGAHPASPLAAGPLRGCEPEFDDDKCYQLALGNLDPFTLEEVDNYDPDSKTTHSSAVRTTGWSQTAVAPHPSIWNANYKDIAAKRKPTATPSFMLIESRPVTKGKSKTIDTSNLQVKNNKKRSCSEEKDLPFDKKPCHGIQDSDIAALYTTASPSFDSLQNGTDSPASEVSAGISPTSPILSEKRSKRNPFARSSPFMSSPQTGVGVETVPDNTPKPSPPESSSPITSNSKFSALSKFSRAIHRTSTDGKPIVQSRYFSSCQQPSDKMDSNHREDRSTGLLRDLSNTAFNCDSVKEPHSSMEDEQNISDSERLPMIHRKPLFASASSPKISDSSDSLLASNKQAVDSVNACFGVDSLNIMHDKFSKQTKGPKLTSPSKNPFRKKSLENMVTEDEENSDMQVAINQNSGSKMISLSTPEEEMVDDAGLELSLSPCSSSPRNVSSQPDEGFESPSKSEPTICSAHTGFSSKVAETVRAKKQACRISGLRKSISSPGQSKLSSFGFFAKPKIPKA